MTVLENETRHDLLAAFGIDAATSFSKLDTIASIDFKYIRDLKINTLNALKFQHLSEKEALLIFLSVAVNQNNELLIAKIAEKAKAIGVTDVEIAEVISIVSLLNINNVYYRFRHFIEKDYYNLANPGIKMSIMLNPLLGKELFELLSLCVSAINGCEMCVKSHEASVIQHGATQEKVHDAIKVTAIAKGFMVML
jgi:alkyl hydroperoxide reductase subunit D